MDAWATATSGQLVHFSNHSRFRCIGVESAAAIVPASEATRRMLAGAPDEVAAPGVSKTGGPPYVFRSAPIPVGYLRADCWEWKQGISGSLSYSRSLMAAREVAILLSGDRALSVPSGFDHVWTITSDQASRQAVLQKVSAERGMDPAPSSSSSPPSRRLWQNCLRFTVQARLAPQWNKVGLAAVSDRYVFRKPILNSFFNSIPSGRPVLGQGQRLLVGGKRPVVGGGETRAAQRGVQRWTSSRLRIGADPAGAPRHSLGQVRSIRFMLTLSVRAPC